MVDYITIEDRNLLHETTKSLMTLLQHHVMHNREDTRLTASLLKRAWRAVLACPGFTPTMKDDIVVICNIDTSYAMELGLAPFAAEWRFLWTIGPKKGAPVDLVLVSFKAVDICPQVTLTSSVLYQLDPQHHCPRTTTVESC